MSKENFPLQLTLGVSLDDDANFENYHRVDENRHVVEALNTSFSMHYLWGAENSGRTHLLQAVCHKASSEQRVSIYIPLQDHENLSATMLEDLSALHVVCLDDVNAIAGVAEWERAVFNFYNNAREAGTQLLLASNCAPHDLQLELPDLRSRLQSMPVYRLANMTDEQAVAAMQHRARQRGIDLNAATAEFILRRSGRGIAQLMELLSALDSVSLTEKRKVTIPLIKEVMNW